MEQKATPDQTIISQDIEALLKNLGVMEDVVTKLIARMREDLLLARCHID